MKIESSSECSQDAAVPEDTAASPASRLGVRHVGIIMDGNGRWAQRRGLPRLEGHEAGADAVDRTVEAAREVGLDALTLYAFSTENWQRPDTEVDGLFALLHRSIREQRPRLHRHAIRFHTLGDLGPLPVPLVRELETLRDETRGYSGMTLSVAVNYGGRDELVRATRALAQQVSAGELTPDDIDEERIGRQLDTWSCVHLPDPDLIVRTSGEFRLSNFLLWQAAYSEVYITDTLWPDFGADDLHAAMRAFAGRERRFGAVPARGAP